MGDHGTGLAGDDQQAMTRMHAPKSESVMRIFLILPAVFMAAMTSGCAALTNPLSEAVPVRRVPPEFLGEPREEKETIPLTLLRQAAPEAYQLAAGDILGVYIEGILPATVVGQTPPTPPV